MTLLHRLINPIDYFLIPLDQSPWYIHGLCLDQIQPGDHLNQLGVYMDDVENDQHKNI
jgi:hypothetical protein